MRLSISQLIGVVLVLLLFAARTARSDDLPIELLGQFEFDLKAHTIPRRVEKVESDGTLRLIPSVDLSLDESLHDEQITEGYYLGILIQKPKSLFRAQLLRLSVKKVDEGGVLLASVSNAAAKGVKAGHALFLVRPLYATTAQMESVPDMVPLKKGKPPVKEPPKETDPEDQLLESLSNLKQIGIGIHNYNLTMGCLPPAVIQGPDGKPWHSWRILVLRLIPNYRSDVCEAYRFDEPWNGPNNKLLLKRMPRIYADPIAGEDNNQYTNYAAISGSGTIFTTAGSKHNENSPGSGCGKKLRAIVDGASTTLMIGPVSTEARIPWTKPQDVVLTQPFPELGTAGSFSLPYTQERKKVGPFLFGDGGVGILSEDLAPDRLRGLMTMAGREHIDQNSFQRVSLKPPPPPMSKIYIVRQGTETTAWISHP